MSPSRASHRTYEAGQTFRTEEPRIGIQSKEGVRVKLRAMQIFRVQVEDTPSHSIPERWLVHQTTNETHLKSVFVHETLVTPSTAHRVHKID